MNLTRFVIHNSPMDFIRCMINTRLVVLNCALIHMLSIDLSSVLIRILGTICNNPMTHNQWVGLSNHVIYKGLLGFI